MYNRVRAAFEFRETKVRWNLFNDLPEIKPSHNIAPDRGDILTVVRCEPCKTPNVKVASRPRQR
jgi:hypothetical protein